MIWNWAVWFACSVCLLEQYEASMVQDKHYMDKELDLLLYV